MLIHIYIYIYLYDWLSLLSIHVLNLPRLTKKVNQSNPLLPRTFDRHIRYALSNTIMGQADRHERRHRSNRKDDRNPPETQARLDDTSKSVHVTSERSCLPSEKQDSISEWIKATGTRRIIKNSSTESDHQDDLADKYAVVSPWRQRSRERELSRSPTPTHRRSRYTRDLTRHTSNMDLSKGKRSKKTPRGTRNVDERAVSPLDNEGYAWLEGDAFTVTPETRKAKLRTAERRTGRSSKEKDPDSSPYVKGDQTWQQHQFYVDPSVERSPSRSPLREREHNASTAHRSTRRGRPEPSRTIDKQDQPSRRKNSYDIGEGLTVILHGPKENRIDRDRSRRLPPASEDLETSDRDRYALTRNRKSHRQYSRSPTRQRSPRQVRSRIVQTHEYKDCSAVVPASRRQGSEEETVLEPGKFVVVNEIVADRPR